MAKLSGDGKYVTVEKGDTLWAIATKYLGAGKQYQQLASWNNISNPDKITIGQKIYLSKQSTSTSTTSNSNKVIIKTFGIQSDSDNTLYVTWTWSKESQTLKYLVEWTYDTGNGVWFVGDSGENTVDKYNRALSRQDTFTIPSNAKKVRVRVRPVSVTYTKNKKETTHWTGAWSSYKTWTDSTPLDTPSTPTVKIEKYKLTASLDNIDITGATQIQFQIYKNDGKSAYKTGLATITATKAASWSYTVGSGAEYKVRCRAKKGSTYSDWSDFSGGVSCDMPNAPSKIKKVEALSETSLWVDWDHVAKVDRYVLEYTTKEIYFDSSSNNVSSVTIDASVTNHAEITGLQSGTKYFFRLRCENDGEGNVSAWTAIKSIVIGEKPSAPTTWSSTTTGITGEDVTLYWVHNSVDGSSQTYAKLEITINGIKTTETIKNTTDEDEKDNTSSYKIRTTSYTEGTNITWRVRTRGITNEYSDWSIERTITIYAPPELELGLTDASGEPVETLSSFPLHISALPGPNTQAPTSYHLSITANESYETVDNVGNEKIVSRGEEVYSQYFDIQQNLSVDILPNHVDLENGVEYKVTCVVSMDSGLTATETAEFSVSWTDEIYTPNAEISYDEERYVTHITPYCMNHDIVYEKVTYSDGKYVKNSQVFHWATSENVYTETGEQVFIGWLPDGSRTYYCTVYTDENGYYIEPRCHKVIRTDNIFNVDSKILNRDDITQAYTEDGTEVYMGLTTTGSIAYYTIDEQGTLVDDVKLSVYRREYDGSFVEIATGLNNVAGTTVTDPHPALDYARYRIVAVSDITGAISVYDVPGYPIYESAAIIQWDEDWSTFDTTEAAELEQPAWTGSLIRLPYNVDVFDSNNVDSTQVQYVGRKHPVSYYGTQLGVTSRWSVEIAKNDKDTLYALRRLAVWMGDIYVREPSGSGYWASVKVSFSQTHRELTIPVSLDITRVEGGA